MSPKPISARKTASVMGILSDVSCDFRLVFFWLVREDGSVIDRFHSALDACRDPHHVYKIYNLKSSERRARVGEMEIDAPAPREYRKKLRSLERMKKDR
jgi:hypothetical protein